MKELYDLLVVPGLNVFISISTQDWRDCVVPRVSTVGSVVLDLTKWKYSSMSAGILLVLCEKAQLIWFVEYPSFEFRLLNFPS